MMRVWPLAITTLSGVLLASSMAPAQDANPGEAELTVTARLKRIKADFRASGTTLLQCQIRVSSGVPSLDRLMCTMLRACLDEGHTGQARAQACVNQQLARAKSAARTPRPMDFEMAFVGEEAPPGAPAAMATFAPDLDGARASPKSGELGE